MALPENIANTSIPGEVTTLTTLAKEVTSVATEIEVNAKPPAALEASGQFRIVVGKEIMLVTAGQTTTKWTVTRKVEGTTAAAYASGTPIFHFLTAEALKNLLFGEWQTASLVEGEAATGFPSYTPGYRLECGSTVLRFRGNIRATKEWGLFHNMFTLAAGFRPEKAAEIPVYHTNGGLNQAGFASVATNGEVNIQTGGKIKEGGEVIMYGSTISLKT